MEEKSVVTYDAHAHLEGLDIGVEANVKSFKKRSPLAVLRLQRQCFAIALQRIRYSKD